MEPQIITVSPDGRASASPDHHEDLALWKKSLKKVFHELGLTEHPGQTDENGMYRQFVAKFEKELEKKIEAWKALPEQYRTYLNYLLQYVAKENRKENSPSDPWILAWIDARAVPRAVGPSSNPTWNPCWDFATDARRPEQAENDLFSFGKRAFVMEFKFQPDKKKREMKPQSFEESRPTVDRVRRDRAFIGPPEGLRWIHLPANNMFWVETLVKAIYENDLDSSAKEALDLTILNSQFWRGRQDANSVNTSYGDRQCAPFMRPTCLATRIGKLTTSLKRSISPIKNEDSTGAEEKDAKENKAMEKDVEDERTDVALFMPVIHWETDIARLQQYYIMSDIDTQLKSDTALTEEEINRLPCSIDEKLLRRYLRHESPMHVRRTLDQAYYYTLDDTQIRDRDQVVLRYARKKISEGNGGVCPRVLMVDQCWLWVIGKIVITCLPDVFNDEDKVYEKDSPHFVERIARTMRRDYEQIRSPHDLAAIIVESCTASASVTELGDAAPESETQFENFQYLDWFSLSIREVMAAQTGLFERFVADSERMVKATEFIDPATEYKFRRAEYEGKRSQARENLFNPAPTENAKRLSKVFDITEESVKLREIKDVQDELQMIEQVLIQQDKAVSKLSSTLRSRDKRVEQALSNINKDVDIIHRYQLDARQAYDELTVLLDLKQKQANISEAHSSRLQAYLAYEQAKLAYEQADETSRQGTIIMLFTIVTILFLPLSTISSIFGLNARELNGGSLSIGIVFAYLFPISLVIVMFAILLAFHENARQFLTLILQILFEYADYISGFSNLFRESRIDKMKGCLSVLQEKKRGRCQKHDEGLDAGEKAKEVLPIWQKISSLVARNLQRRGIPSSSEDVELA